MTAGRCSVGERFETVAEARRWIGTPYVHQGSCLGAGADCLGLIRGIWREVIGREPEQPGPYTADWAEAGAGERLLQAARRHLTSVATDQAKPGDVLLFRMRETGPAKHLAILSEGGLERGRIIHAYSGHAVCETSLTKAWVARIAGVFRFPARSD